MPDRAYVPNHPGAYTFRDRLLSHWYAFCLTTGGGILGTLVVVTSLLRWFAPINMDQDHDGRPDPPWMFDDWRRWLDPAPSLAQLPNWEVLVVGVVMIAGSVLWMVANFRTFRFIEDYWKVHRAGLLLLVLGWSTYVFCALGARPEWVVPWWLGAINAVAHIGGFVLSLNHQRRLQGARVCTGRTYWDRITRRSRP